MECEYCNAKFSSNKSLKKHKLTAQYCLKRQGKQDEIDKILRSNQCPECKACFSCKDALKKHLILCSSNAIIQNTNIINNTQNNTQNNTLNIGQVIVNVNFGETLSSLTPQSIAEKLIPLLTNEVVKDGVGKMTEIAAINCFVNEKGNWMLRSADVSRNKLELRYDEKDEPDYGCEKTTQLLRPPFLTASMRAVEETEEDEAKTTLNVVRNLNKDNKPVRDALFKNIPKNFESLDASFQKAIDVAEAEVERKLMLRDAKEKKERSKKRIERLSKWIVTSIANSNTGLHWHLDDYYCFRLIVCDKKKAVIQYDSVFISGIELVGYSNTKDGKVIDFGDKELKAIKAIDFDCYLSSKYKQA